MMKKTVVLAAMATVLGMAAWSAPGLGLAGVNRSTYGSYTEEYSNWGGLFLNDTNCDGYGVYDKYRRDAGSEQTFNNYQGCGTSESTGTTGNQIAWFYTCVNDLFNDTCSSTATRP